MWSKLLTDRFRVLGMLFVVVIHGTASAPQSLVYGTPQFTDHVGLWLNQLARFSVPLFLTLSGYGLAASAKGLPWLWSKAERILYPWLAWSLLLLFPIIWMGDYSQVFRKFIMGRAYYHLYFLPIILQCYVLFPLFYKLAEQRIRGMLVLIALLLIQYVWMGGFGVEKIPYRLPAVVSIHWLGYFFAGVLIQRHTWPKLSSHWSVGVLCVLSVLGVTTLLYQEVIIRILKSVAKLGIKANPDQFLHFQRPLVMLLWLTALLILHWLSKQSSKQLGLEQFAGISFFVYLVHPIIQTGLSHWLKHPLLLPVLVGIAAIFLGIGINRMVKWDLGRKMIGLG